MSSLLQILQSALAPHRGCRRWLVAYSGGLDSQVLLQLLADWRDSTQDALPPIEAIHIDHQLQPDSAGWAEHCRLHCRELDIALHSQTVTVRCGPRQSLEAQARAARYLAFEQVLEPGDLLLMAHHRDDQAETLLLRLLRGSGQRGLAAIPAERALGAGRLLRPLLGVERSALEAWARGCELSWIEDPSNADPRYDRNYLRLQLLPLLEARWPAYRDTLARSAAHAADSAELLRQLADEDLARLAPSVGVTLGAGPGLGSEPRLPVAPLLALDARRRDNLLRHWLARHGAGDISAATLQRLVDEVLGASADAMPQLVVGGRQLRRYRGELYVTALTAAPDSGWRGSWTLGAPLQLEGAGILYAEPVQGGGLRCGGEVEVGFRRGGERCRPAGRGHSQSLKKLLQEYALPPWWRDRVPLIYVDGELAAVGDLWVCAGFAAAPGERGWQLRWRRGA